MGLLNVGNKVVRGLLDMDKPSRMARAKEQGFDTDKKVYHGTADDFDAFDPDRSIGTQFWSTTNKAEIESGDVGAQGSGVIKEMYHRIKNPAGWEEYDKFGIDELIREGYDGLKLPHGKGDYTYVAFDPSQYRSVDAAFDPAKTSSSNLLASNPVATAAAGAGGLLAMTGSEDSEAGVVSSANKVVRGLMDMSTPARMQRAEDMGFDTNTNWYHGTNDLENIAKTGFDPSFTGKGNDQFGSGFYFSTTPSQASSFATNLNRNKAGEVQPAGIIKAHLALKNPLVVDGTKVSNINDLPIDLSSDDVRELLEYSTALKRGLDDEQMNPMGDQFSEFWDDGPTDEMMDKLVDTYTNSNLSAIEGDLFDGNATAFREGLAKVTGYDGIVIDFGDGFKNAVAWKPEQVRSTSAKFDPRKANRGDLTASNPVATTSAGILAAIAASQSDKSYADYSPSNLARLRNDDVGGYQAAQSPQLARASGLMGQINERGVDDPLMGLISPRMPNELINKMAYNDKRGIADYLKSAAGLLGFY
tara:strand:+ start:435 stop:2024 length:1590 start_codon:yes stop_codon:yes gene_type:complete